MTEMSRARRAPILRVPHTLVLMTAMMAAALILTWILPAGSFEMEANEAGRMMVVPGTYAEVDDAPTTCRRPVTRSRCGCAMRRRRATAVMATTSPRTS